MKNYLKSGKLWLRAPRQYWRRIPVQELLCPSCQSAQGGQRLAGSAKTPIMLTFSIPYATMGYMIQEKEISVCRIAIATEQNKGIGLSRFLYNLNLPFDRQLNQVQIAFLKKGAVTPKNLGQLINDAFGSLPVKARKIYQNYPTLTEKDAFFAKKFGLALIPHFAHLKRNPDETIEAWISPVLLSQSHPLAKEGAGNTAVLFTGLISTQLPSFKDQVVRFDDLCLGRYVRLTVADEQGVLGTVCNIFGKADINIHELRQPESQTGSLVATPAFILNPCLGNSFNNALEAIRALPSCQSIDATLPVIAPELPGFVRK